MTSTVGQPPRHKVGPRFWGGVLGLVSLGALFWVSAALEHLGGPVLLVVALGAAALAWTDRGLQAQPPGRRVRTALAGLGIGLVGAAVLWCASLVYLLQGISE